MDQENLNQETGCCTKFNTEPWDEKEMTFNNKLFIKDKVRSAFHIPLNFGAVMKRNMEKIKKAGAEAENYLALSDEKSSWGSDLLIHVSKEVPEAEMVRLSGAFLTKVFEGGYKDMSKWIKEMQEFVQGRGKEMKKMYFFYTTCPKCAKVHGKNYVVILAEV